MALDQDNDPAFLVFRGGPFYNLQLKTHLLDGIDLKPLPRALILMAIAWGIPLLLTLVAGTAFGMLEARPYLLDPGTFARFFLAIGLFIFAETQIENHLSDAVRYFFTGHLLDEKSLVYAKAAIRQASERLDARLGEIICLTLAILASAVLMSNMQQQASSSWAMTINDEGRSLSLAGWWSIVISNTLFWFLLLRAVLRHIVWALLLRDFSRLGTRLVATHPDGHAGLSFVGRYPNGYILFTIAVSSVVAGTLTHQVLHGTVTATAFGSVMGLWLAVIFAYFGIPLIGFARVLGKLKRQTLLAASARATDYQRHPSVTRLARTLSAVAKKPSKAMKYPIQASSTMRRKSCHRCW